MLAVEFIETKRDGKTHTGRDIRDFILAYSRGEIPDYQASAWLMAAVLNGLDEQETFALTQAMVDSGGTLDLSPLPGYKIDKHSTGGVGDKVTLAVVPLLAAAEIPVAKMSGRGLGFTGGTLDKLESIPGFRVSLSRDEIIATVAAAGACICAQTGDLVPADRKLYALRDVTGTVESLPLIAASIMSKKIAGGSDAVLLDVKMGRGAFMKTLDDAMSLAAMLVKIGKAHGMVVEATISSMDAPLGRCVGNWIEVQEIASLLRGEVCDERLREEVVHLAAKGLTLAQKGGRDDVERMLLNGDAWAKFQQMVTAQGGQVDVFDKPPRAASAVPVLSDCSGYVADIDALAIGRAAMKLGAGRERKEDAIDPLAGIEIVAPLAFRVAAGDPIAFLYSANDERAANVTQTVAGAFRIVAEQPRTSPVLLGELSSRSAK